MASAEPLTFFDTPGRSLQADVDAMARVIAADAVIPQLLDSHPNLAVVLDDNRHIVALNRAALTLIDQRSAAAVAGQRFGEALGCIHAHDEPAGCGTTVYCCECGAAHAVRGAREHGHPVVADCRITVRQHDEMHALDLRVHATPTDLAGKRVTVLSIEDVAAEKRREALERIFFHDVLNTATALEGSARLLAEYPGPAEVRELAGMLLNAAEQLVGEIRAQRDLVRAERGDLLVHLDDVPARLVLSTIHDIYATAPAAHGKRLTVDMPDETVVVHTHLAQATRALGNLVKNALEATPAGGEVRLWSDPTTDSGVAFHVHNRGAIPESLQHQIFQRSFTSTGEPGRGLGTYSARLIVERYLRGRVAFRSDESSGTIFTVWLPRVG